MISCICYDPLFIDGKCRMCGGEEDPPIIQSDGELLALAERLRTFGRTSAPWTASFAIKQLMEERDNQKAIADGQTRAANAIAERIGAAEKRVEAAEEERDHAISQLTEEQTA